MGGKKITIGILGAIGSGKSTVAAEFEKRGCAVIDADKIAHELLDTGGVKTQLIEAFGPQICSKEGLIQRDKLADIVFESSQNVTRINEIIHPLVFERTKELIERYTGQSEIQAVVLDIPLLAETGRLDLCDTLVFVRCPEQIRANRAKKKGLSYEKKLKSREKFQISLDTKAKLAHYIVNNNSDLSALADQVAQIFSALTN